MWSKNKIAFSFLVPGLLSMAACTKKLDSNAHDPNGTPSNELKGKDFFAGTLVEIVSNKSGLNLYNAVDNYDYANEWMGYFCRNNGWAASGAQVEVESFQMNNSFSDGVWGSNYHTIYDLNFVIANSTANSILPGAARALRVMLFQDLVDQFGNIPYSKAENPALSLTPTYDSALSIYRDLNLQLDTAITEINASQATADDASDVMFKGDKTSWLQFANTMKLRVLLRQVPNGDQAYVTSENAQIPGGFLTVGGLVQPGYANVATKQNPFWTGYSPGSQNYNSFCANVTMLNFLDSISDPRVAYFYAPSGAGPF